MLPYVKLQLEHAALAGGLAAVLWWASAALQEASRSLTLRLAAVAAGTAGGTVLAWRLVVDVLALPYASGFMVIALTFYAGAFWLPVFGGASLLAARRRAAEKRPRDGVAAALLCALAPAVGLYALLVEPNRLQVREERVPVAAWPAGAAPLRVVHLSDLQTVGACARERRALAAVRAADPDLIVISGDYISGPFRDTGPAVAAARAFLGGLAARHGVVVVAGHSEVEHHRAEIFAGQDLVYLRNGGHRIDLGGGRSLLVFGLDPWRPDLEPLAAPKSAGEARLVVSHVPDVTRRLDGLGVDLHCAGHTHGGQVALPGFGPLLTLSSLPRRYARGLHAFGDHLLNVCAGLGMEGNHAPRVRLFCPPEICVLVLEGAGGRAPAASD